MSAGLQLLFLSLVGPNGRFRVRWRAPRCPHGSFLSLAPPPPPSRLSPRSADRFTPRPFFLPLRVGAEAVAGRIRQAAGGGVDCAIQPLIEVNLGRAGFLSGGASGHTCSWKRFFPCFLWGGFIIGPFLPSLFFSFALIPCQGWNVARPGVLVFPAFEFLLLLGSCLFFCLRFVSGSVLPGLHAIFSLRLISLVGRIFAGIYLQRCVRFCTWNQRFIRLAVLGCLPSHLVQWLGLACTGLPCFPLTWGLVACPDLLRELLVLKWLDLSLYLVCVGCHLY